MWTLAWCFTIHSRGENKKSTNTERETRTRHLIIKPNGLILCHATKFKWNFCNTYEKKGTHFSSVVSVHLSLLLESHILLLLLFFWIYGNAITQHFSKNLLNLMWNSSLHLGYRIECIARYSVPECISTLYTLLPICSDIYRNRLGMWTSAEKEYWIGLPMGTISCKLELDIWSVLGSSQRKLPAKWFILRFIFHMRWHMTGFFSPRPFGRANFASCQIYIESWTNTISNRTDNYNCRNNSIFLFLQMIVVCFVCVCSFFNSFQLLIPFVQKALSYCRLWHQCGHVFRQSHISMGNTTAAHS